MHACIYRRLPLDKLHHNEDVQQEHFHQAIVLKTVSLNIKDSVTLISMTLLTLFPMRDQIIRSIKSCTAFKTFKFSIHSFDCFNISIQVSNFNRRLTNLTKMVISFQFRIESFIADCAIVSNGCFHFGPSAQTWSVR